MRRRFPVLARSGRERQSLPFAVFRTVRSACGQSCADALIVETPPCCTRWMFSRPARRPRSHQQQAQLSRPDGRKQRRFGPARSPCPQPKLLKHLGRAPPNAAIAALRHCRPGDSGSGRPRHRNLRQDRRLTPLRPKHWSCSEMRSCPMRQQIEERRLLHRRLHCVTGSTFMLIDLPANTRRRIGCTVKAANLHL